MAEDLRAELARVDVEAHQAPVNVNLGDTVPLAVPDIQYHNYGSTPVKMKLNNTGYTVTVSGKFEDGTHPAISGGPLEGTYKFSQLHFHWGPHDGEGSEHTFEGRSVPLEMHVVHVNDKYATQEEALLKRDGVAILAFLFVSGGKHAGLDNVVRGLSEVSAPHTSFKITPQALQSMCTPFQADYFSYWGSVISPSCSHLIQWMISRSPLQASPDQFAAFRGLLNVNEEPLLRNYRDTQAMSGRTVFHLAPGDREGFTLHCGVEQTSVATPASDRRPEQQASLLSVEGPCTSVEGAGSKHGADEEDEGLGDSREPSAPEEALSPVRTASGRELRRTPSGNIIDPKAEAPPGLERTASGRELQRTPSGRVLERTPSGREVERTPSGRELERTPSGRALERTPSGRLRSPSGRIVVRTPSGHLLEVVSPDAAEEPPAGASEAAPSSQLRTPSGRPLGQTRSMLSRVVSFSELDNPVKELSGNEWPNTPYEGADVASPVFLDTKDVQRLPLPPLEFLGHFQKGSGLVLTNSGETVEISLLKATERPVLQGGPLQGRYILDSAHFHWLPNEDAMAGTHTINNARAEIECHLVHIHEDFKTKTEAMDHPNGMAVVSVMHQVGGEECEAFVRMCKELPRINELYTQVELPNADLAYMASVVKPHGYFLYPGRFFGRNDGKALVWIVFAQPVGICCQNVTAFQNLRRALDFRPHDTYALGARPLYAVISEPEQPAVEELIGEGQPVEGGEGGAVEGGEGQAVEGGVGEAVEGGEGEAVEGGEKDIVERIDTDAAEGAGGAEGMEGAERMAGEEGAPGPEGAEGGDGGLAVGDEGLDVGEMRRTASGRVLGLGADEWPNVPFESRHGILMAPLDVSTSTVPSMPMKPLEYRGHFAANSIDVEIRNTGEAVDLKFLGLSPMPALVGGPLTDEYELDSAHFHWAQNPEDVGAMHRVNGKRCDLEFHMVHFKKSLKTRQEAMFEPDGLAVCSFLIQVGGEENESFRQLSDALPAVQEVDAGTRASLRLDWLQHRAGPHGYFTYPGTLFGADKGINVVWMVYPTPVQICCQHVAHFYKLNCLDCDRMHPLYEPLDRPLFYSINPDDCAA